MILRLLPGFGRNVRADVHLREKRKSFTLGKTQFLIQVQGTTPVAQILYWEIPHQVKRVSDSDIRPLRRFA
jgi:hypothetical protein